MARPFPFKVMLRRLSDEIDFGSWTVKSLNQPPKPRLGGVFLWVSDICIWRYQRVKSESKNSQAHRADKAASNSSSFLAVSLIGAAERLALLPGLLRSISGSVCRVSAGLCLLRPEGSPRRGQVLGALGTWSAEPHRPSGAVLPGSL